MRSAIRAFGDLTQHKYLYLASSSAECMLEPAPLLMRYWNKARLPPAAAA